MKIVTNDGGRNYKLTELNLTRNNWYKMGVYQDGYTFNIPNFYVPIPYEPIPVQTKIINTGYYDKLYISFNYNVANLLTSDITVTPSSGSLISLSTEDLGIHYVLEGNFEPNTEYTFTIVKYGYEFSDIKLKTMQEPIVYTLKDIFDRFGISSSTYTLYGDGYRWLGSKYAIYPIIRKSDSRLYGLMWSEKITYGNVNDWHFLNLPVDVLNSSYYANDKYLELLGMRSNTIYYQANYSSGTTVDRTGDLYSFDMSTYVDGKTASWTSVVGSSEYVDNQWCDDICYSCILYPMNLSTNQNSLYVNGRNSINRNSTYDDTFYNGLRISSTNQLKWYETGLTYTTMTDYSPYKALYNGYQLIFCGASGGWGKARWQSSSSLSSFKAGMSPGVGIAYYPFDWKYGEKSRYTIGFDAAGDFVCWQVSYNPTGLRFYYPYKEMKNSGNFKFSKLVTKEFYDKNGEEDNNIVGFAGFSIADGNSEAHGLQRNGFYWSWGSSCQRWYFRELFKEPEEDGTITYVCINYNDYDFGFTIIRGLPNDNYNLKFCCFKTDTEICLYQSPINELIGTNSR